MVDFNTQVAPTNDPDFVRQASAGIVQPAPGNQSGASLGAAAGIGLAGLGKAVVDAADTVDKGVDSSIKNDVNSGVDRLRDAQGVDLAQRNAATAGDPLGLNTKIVSSPGTDPNQTPPNADALQGGIARLQAAYRQGAIGDTNYYAQLEAMTRQIRARYPGYRDQVDQMVQSVTGIQPANALRKSLETDLRAGQAQLGESQKTMTEQINKWRTDGLLQRAAPDYSQNPDKYSGSQGYALLASQVASVAGQDATIAKAKADLDYQTADKVAKGKSAEALATTTVNGLVDSALAKGSVYSNLETKLSTHDPNTPWEPAELAQIQQQASLLKKNISDASDAQLNTPLHAGTNDSLASVINDPSKVKAIREAALTRVDDLLQLVTDKDMGALQANANLAKGQTDAAVAKFMIADQTNVKIKAMTQIYGPQAFSTMLEDKTGDGMNAVQSAMHTALQINLASPGGSLTQAFKTLTDNKAKPVEYTSLIRDTTTQLLDPKVPDAMKVQLATSLFGSKDATIALAGFTKASQLDTFTKLASPAVTKSMLSLKDSSPEGQAAWGSYKDFVVHQFIGQFRQSTQDLNQQAGDRSGITLSYDPKANQFGAQKNVTSGYQDMTSGTSLALVKAQLAPLNRALAAVSPVIQGDGRDVSKELTGLLSNDMGINVPGLQKQLLDAVAPGTSLKVPAPVAAPQGRLDVKAVPGKQSQADGPPAGSLLAYAGKVAQGDQAPAADAISGAFPAVDKIQDAQAKEFLSPLSTHGAASVEGMQPVLRTRLASMIQAAPPDVQKGIGIFSGFRDRKTQEALFANSDGSGRMVAHPGHSEHELGLAADLSYNGRSLRYAPQDVINWVKENAPKFHLKFPMSYEAWHIEPEETRGGGKVD